MKFILILAIILLGVMLMACGGSDEATTPAPMPKPEFTHSAMKEEAPKALVHSVVCDLLAFYGSTDRGAA